MAWEEAGMRDSQRMPRKDCSPFSWMQSLKSERGKTARLSETRAFKGVKSFSDKFVGRLDRETNEQHRRLDNENE